MFVLDVLTYGLLAYLAWAVLYQLLPSIMGHFFKREKGKSDGQFRRFAVLIPAYKDDAVIVDTVKSALKQNYPDNLYEILPIADQLQRTTIQRIKRLGVRPLEVDFEKSTKAKSLNAALEFLGDDFDAAVVLDADNHPNSNFLLHMNETLGKGYTAIQGCRVAKNGNTAFAMLDGVSEAVNNHLLCAGHRALGLSARLAGSGMAFDYALFKNVMKDIKALGGFDKELELRLTQREVKIGYAPAATVLDEKVDNPNTFARQRGRWLAAQYRYGKRFAGSAFRSLLTRGNYDFFHKTLQMGLPPRLVLPVILTIGTLISTVFGAESATIWQLLLVGNISSFALAIPRSFWTLDFAKALLQLPFALLSTFKALALIPRAGKEFLHTSKNFVQAES